MYCPSPTSHNTTSRTRGLELSEPSLGPIRLRVNTLNHEVKRVDIFYLFPTNLLMYSELYMFHVPCILRDLSTMDNDVITVESER